MGKNNIKLRRSMLFVPGSNAAMLSNSFIYKPDVIMFDLEDAVALREKDSARYLVSQALQHPFYADFEKVVRVNPLDSEFGYDDLQMVVRAGTDVVRLPKTDTAKDVTEMEKIIAQIEQESNKEIGTTKMLAAIESPLGIMNALEIAYSSPRLIGIALGAEDYVRSLRTERSAAGLELLFARSTIIHAARSAEIMAFDTVFSDVNDIEGFLEEVKLIKQLGFDGKSLINPRQIELLHNQFAPTLIEVNHAKLVISAAKQALEKGSGVVSINGKMVDKPVIERARLVIEKFKTSGVREE